MMMFSIHSRLALLIVGGMLSAQVAADDGGFARSVEYVQSLDSQCTLTDGYQCVSVDESTITMNAAMMVPARYLEVWPVVYLDFYALDILSDEQKKIKHYHVGFAEDDDHFIVIFRALLLPEVDESNQVTGTSRATIGQSMRYLVDKNTRQVVSRQAYR